MTNFKTCLDARVVTLSLLVVLSLSSNQVFLREVMQQQLQALNGLSLSGIINSPEENITQPINIHSVDSPEDATRNRLSKEQVATRLSTEGYHYQDHDKNDSQDCTLTVLAMDPRIAAFPRSGQFYRNAMESVAEYTPSATCIVFQTSSCRLRQYLERGFADLETINYLDNYTSKRPGAYVPELPESGLNESVTDDQVHSAMAYSMYIRAGPFLQRLIERGRTRISILNHTKYNLHACDVFYNPRNAWMSASYWVDEFVPQDADLILVTQRDAFLCKPLSLVTWGSFAYVGAPWAPTVGGGAGQKLAFTKNKIRRKFASDAKYNLQSWRAYWRNQGAAYRGHLNTGQASSCVAFTDRVNHIHCPLPPFPPDITWPESFPLKGGDYRVGNGGFSVRSRKWHIRAIRTCPDHKVSQLKSQPTTCNVIKLWDDVYFSLLLNLIGAPMPNPYEAMLFSSDTAWPNEFFDNETIRKISGDVGLDLFWNETRYTGHAIPVGIHKCYNTRFISCPPRRYCKYSFNETWRR